MRLIMVMAAFSTTAWLGDHTFINSYRTVQGYNQGGIVHRPPLDIAAAAAAAGSRCRGTPVCCCCGIGTCRCARHTVMKDEESVGVLVGLYRINTLELLSQR